MAERIAHGEVLIEVSDREALARLRALQAEYQSMMRRIDNERATATIDADIKQFEKDLATVAAQLKALDKDETVLTLRADKEEVDDALDDVKRAIARVNKDKANAIALGADTKPFNAELKKLRAELASLKSEKLEIEAVLKGSDKAIAGLKSVNKQTRESIALSERRLRRLVREQTAEEKKLRLAQRAEQLRQRELAEVPRLELAYAKLQLRLEKIASAKRTLSKSDSRARITLDLEEDAALGELERLRSEVVRRTGNEPITLPVDLSFSERAGARIRREAQQAARVYQDEFNLGKRQGSNLFASAAVLPLAAAFGADIGSRAGNSARDTFRRTFEKGMGRGLTDVGKGALTSAGTAAIGLGSKLAANVGKLGDASVRLGPFTASIRTATIAVSVLAPVLVSVIGAMGALVAVAGSAALGVGALGAALAGGAVPAMLGFGLVIKDVVQEFANAKKAQKAYDDAVMKHGKGSEQAAKKMKELRQTLSGVSQETAEQFASAQKLGKAWDAATRPARASVWTAVGEGIKTAGVLMGDFAKRTNTGMGLLEKGTTSWMKALRSAAGQQILGSMMDRFNQSLLPAMSGLGDLAAYFAKVGQAAAVHLPGLAQTFSVWAKGLNNTAGFDNFQSKIDNVVQSAKDVGRFFMSAGRFMKAFFAGGVESGQELVRTMSDALDRWTMMLETGGRDGLENFFERSVAGAQALYSVLAPIIASFSKWATLMEPIVTPFLQGAGVFGRFAAALLDITALRGPLTALAATLGVMWSAGKIAAAAEGVRKFAAALFGLSKAQAAVATTGAAANAAGLIGGAGAAAGAARGASAARAAETAAAAASVAAASKSGKAAQAGARSAGLLRGAMAGLGLTALTSTAALSATTAGIGLLAAAALYGGYKLATMKTQVEKLNEQYKEARAQASGYGRDIDTYVEATVTASNSSREYAQAVGSVAAVKRRMSALESQGKRDTQEYADLQQRIRPMLEDRAAAESRRGAAVMRAASAEAQATAKVGRLTEASFASTASLVKAKEKLADATKELAYAEKTNDPERAAFARRNLAKAEQEYNAAAAKSAQTTGELERALNKVGAADSNIARAKKGMVDLGAQAEQAVGNLARQAPKLAVKISTKFEDPKDAAAVARRASAALKSGTPKNVVTKAAIDSGSAKNTLRELNAAKITPKRLKIISEGGKPALAQLRNIVGTKLAPKVLRVLENGVLTTKGKIKALEALGIAPKTARILADDKATGKVKRVMTLRIGDMEFTIDATDDATPKVNAVRGLSGQVIGTAIFNIRGVKTGFWGAGGIGGTINVGVRTPRPRGKADGGYAFAEGGFASTPNIRQQMRAEQTAILSGSQPLVSRKVNKPTLLVGEEATPEFVIATNPAYRLRNQKYAAQAARAVGLDVIDPMVKARVEAKRKNDEAEAGITRAAGGKGGKKKPKPPRRSPLLKGREYIKVNERTNARYKRRTGAIQLLERLDRDKTIAEHNVSTLQGRVQEPDSWVIEQGFKEIDDPYGEKIRIPQYVENTAAITAYQEQLKALMAAMDALKAILDQITSALAVARSTNTSEIMARDDRGRLLNQYLAQEKGKRISGKGKTRDQAREAKEARIEHLRGLIEENKAELGELKDDRASLTERGDRHYMDMIDYKEARREVDEDYANATSGKHASDANAKAEADAWQSALVSGPPQGGGDSGGLSMAQQSAMLSTEKGNAYKAFAGNVINNLASVGGAVAAVLGGGGQKNLASLAGVRPSSAASSVVASGSAAGTVVASGGGVSAAFSSSDRAVSASSAAPGAAPISGGDKNVTINNTFATVPPDPHTWAKGVEFEAATVI